MSEITDEEFVALVGEEAAARIEYALAHPEESVRKRRKRPEPLPPEN